MPLQRILKSHSEILPGKNHLKPASSLAGSFHVPDVKSAFLARNQLLLLGHFISQFLQYAETRQLNKVVHMEIFQSLSEKLPIQQTVQFNFE